MTVKQWFLEILPSDLNFRFHDSEAYKGLFILFYSFSFN